MKVTLKMESMMEKEKEYYKDGEIKYEGIFKNGNFCEGFGKEYYDDGTIKYKEDFKNGKYEGKGREYYKNGEIKR